MDHTNKLITFIYNLKNALSRILSNIQAEISRGSTFLAFKTYPFMALISDGPA